MKTNNIYFGEIIMYDNCRIYGPYIRKDNRQHVIIVYPNGIKKTVSYPKYLMEIKLNRFLTKTETVDHKDGNFSNNDYDNLQILDRPKHISLDVKRYKNIEYEFICQVCSTSFKLSGAKLRYAYYNNRKGPFCSRKCAGIASHNPEKYVQYKIILETTTNKKEMNI